MRKYNKIVGNLIYNTEKRIVDEWTRKNWRCRYESNPPKYVFKFPWRKESYAYQFDTVLNWKQSKKEFIENRDLFNGKYLNFINYIQSNYNVESWECKLIWDLFRKSMVVVYGLNHLNLKL